MSRSDGDVKSAPVPGDCFAPSGRRLPDLPGHRHVPVRRGQRSPTCDYSRAHVEAFGVRASGQTPHLGTGVGRLGTVLAWALGGYGHGALRDAWRHAYVARYGRNQRYAAGCGWPLRSAHSGKLANTTSRACDTAFRSIRSGFVLNSGVMDGQGR